VKVIDINIGELYLRNFMNPVTKLTLDDLQEMQWQRAYQQGCP
jgi:hypothetical protein